MMSLRCPFCDARPEVKGRNYYRCPDIECAGHHWTVERKWSKRAYSVLDRALQDVVTAFSLWQQTGEFGVLSMFLSKFIYLSQHRHEEAPQPEPPEEQPLDNGVVAIYGAVFK